MANEDKLLDYLRRVTAELQRTRKALELAEASRHEPVAVVGMSCRFPGGVTDPQGLWELVAAGADAVGEFPAGRGWDLAALADPGGPGGCAARGGAFLHAAEE